MSGGGAIAQNAILSSTNAYIEDSSLDVGTSLVDADIEIEAENVSAIEAKVLAFAGTVAAGSGTSVGVSIGFAMARNFIGWDPGAGGTATYDSDDQPQQLTTGAVVEVESGPRESSLSKGIEFSLSRDPVHATSPTPGSARMLRGGCRNGWMKPSEVFSRTVALTG